MADETNRNVNEQPQAQDMGELLRIRRDKLKALQDEGRDPFTITRFDVTHHTQDIKDNFDAMFGPAYKGIPLATSAAGALARDYGVDKPYFFNRKEVKDHGEGGSLVGYKPKDGDKIIIIEDVITAGTAVRETMPILYGCGNVKVNDMFISVNRCEVGKVPGKTAIMEVNEEFGIKVHAIVTVEDIHEYLKQSEKYNNILPAMEDYMAKYCIL